MNLRQLEHVTALDEEAGFRAPRVHPSEPVGIDRNAMRMVQCSKVTRCMSFASLPAARRRPMRSGR
jgi:hypothetical protein